MSNHFHVLLDVPPAPEGGISDELLLKRLGALYSETYVDGVAKDLESAREEGDEEMIGDIHGRFTYRIKSKFLGASQSPERRGWRS